MSLDVDRIAAAVVGLMKSSLHGLTERVARLEQHAPVPGPPGERGEPGVDGFNGHDGADGKDGRDGIDGKDGARGEPGMDGLHGKDGADGRDGTDADETRLHVLETALVELRKSFETLAQEHLQHHVIVGPPGRDGSNGRDGLDGKDGRDGLPGVPGLGGRDGDKGLDGKDGRDGLDGLGFEEMSFEYDEQGRGWMVWRRGDVVKKGRMSGAYQGVWKPDGVYLKGDSVSWGGSSWTAMVDTPPGKPETAHSGWILTVQRGREGKPGLAGAEGKQGKDGKDGVDRRWPA